tara:strand:- start:558 stop:692 length:135 start_codon:yes stop_codon:yes gene_type:complete
MWRASGLPKRKEKILKIIESNEYRTAIHKPIESMPIETMRLMKG